jgi:hypothetical protein
MKKLRLTATAVFLLLVSSGLVYGQDRTNKDSIDIYFQEIKINTNLYREMWAADLYGPLLFVDQKTSDIYANAPDSAGLLKKEGRIYTGILPASINIANTAIKWGGTLWAMIMLPLPENKQARLDLLSHELFHSFQPRLHFKMANSSNNHLDQKDGRISLRLELEALRQALNAKSKAETDKNLTNALYFRNMRYAVYPDAKTEENSLELNEGLATYTGIAMSGRNNSQINEYFESKLTDFQNNPSFVRSFAYLTIPLYGTILSGSDKFWNKKVDNNTNLGDFFIKSFNLQIPAVLADDIKNQYGFAKISTGEAKREEHIKQVTAGYKKVFIERPHLEIRLENMNISFDPRNLMPVEGYGTVYPTLRLSDNWGILTVTDGALLGTNWDRVIVSEPAVISQEKVSGKGWTIDLNKGYIVEKDSSGKNYLLKKK